MVTVIFYMQGILWRFLKQFLLDALRSIFELGIFFHHSPRYSHLFLILVGRYFNFAKLFVNFDEQIYICNLLQI